MAADIAQFSKDLAHMTEKLDLVHVMVEQTLQRQDWLCKKLDLQAETLMRQGNDLVRVEGVRQELSEHGKSLNTHEKQLAVLETRGDVRATGIALISTATLNFFFMLAGRMISGTWFKQ